MADLKLALIISALDRASAPLRGIAAAVSGVGSIAATAGRGLATFGLAVQGLQTAARIVTAPIAGLIDTAAEFERLDMRLEALEGSAAGAAKAMDWIRDFAVKTPLEVRDVTQAYAALRNVGIDPTKGALQALTDANAKAGGSAAELGGVIKAITDMWGKGRIQAEEMQQLAERSIPAWPALAKALGKSEAAVRKLAEAGKLGRKDIEALAKQLGKEATGASERFATSWEGILSNLQEHWNNFKLAISKAGVFDTLKQVLQDLLATLDRLAKDGAIGRIATLIGETLTAAITAGRNAFEALIREAGGIEPLAQRLVSGLQEIAPTAAGIAGTVQSLASGFGALADAIRPVIALTDAYWRGYNQTIGAVTRGAASAAGWVGRQLGITGGESAPAAGGSGDARVGGGAGLDRLATPQQRVGGEIVVRIEGAPKGSRIEAVRANGGIEIGAELGLAMGG